MAWPKINHFRLQKKLIQTFNNFGIECKQSHVDLIGENGLEFRYFTTL